MSRSACCTDRPPSFFCIYFLDSVRHEVGNLVTLLSGHPFQAKVLFMDAFTTRDSKKSTASLEPPNLIWLQRSILALVAARPSITISLQGYSSPISSFPWRIRSRKGPRPHEEVQQCPKERYRAAGKKHETERWWEVPGSCRPSLALGWRAIFLRMNHSPIGLPPAKGIEEELNKTVAAMTTPRLVETKTSRNILSWSTRVEPLIKVLAYIYIYPK